MPVALCLSVTTAQAQSLPDNYYFNGFVEHEYMRYGYYSQTFTATDLRLGYLPDTAGGLSFGFELGIEASRGSYKDFAGYAAAIIGTSFGNFQFGAPRAVLPDYVATHVFAGNCGYSYNCKRCAEPTFLVNV